MDATTLADASEDRRRRAGDPRLTDADREILDRMTTGDLADRSGPPSTPSSLPARSSAAGPPATTDPGSLLPRSPVTLKRSRRTPDWQRPSLSAVTSPWWGSMSPWSRSTPQRSRRQRHPPSPKAPSLLLTTRATRRNVQYGGRSGEGSDLSDLCINNQGRPGIASDTCFAGGQDPVALPSADQCHSDQPGLRAPAPPGAENGDGLTSPHLTVSSAAVPVVGLVDCRGAQAGIEPAMGAWKHAERRHEPDQSVPQPRTIVGTDAYSMGCVFVGESRHTV